MMGYPRAKLPIALSCFSHVDILGFCRRRSDLFAITQNALQAWLKGASKYGRPIGARTGITHTLLTSMGGFPHILIMRLSVFLIIERL